MAKIVLSRASISCVVCMEILFVEFSIVGMVGNSMVGVVRRVVFIFSPVIVKLLLFVLNSMVPFGNNGDNSSNNLAGTRHSPVSSVFPPI